MESEILKEEGTMWIESHDSLETNPKTTDLLISMDWTLDQTIGKLHRFWWWCTKYALDGDLRKHSAIRIGVGIGLDKEDYEKFLKAMIGAGFIDEVPYFRVHDWWEYVEWYLKGKYKNAPEKWRAIKDLYAKPQTDPLRDPQTAPVTQNIPTNQPLPTNQQHMPDTNAAGVSIALVFPCKGMGKKEWGLTKEKLAEYQEAFPAMDVLAEARHALQWTRDNPTKRKTERGMPAFLTRWFGRNQNQGGSSYGAQRKVGRVEAEPGKYDKLKTGGQTLPKMPEPTQK